jgi:hypothetical protein
MTTNTNTNTAIVVTATILITAFAILWIAAPLTAAIGSVVVLGYYIWAPPCTDAVVEARRLAKVTPYFWEEEG